MSSGAAILEIAEEVLSGALGLLPVDGVRFKINPPGNAIVPEVGVGGSCFRRDLVSIHVSPRLDPADEKNRRLIRYTVAHELHHAARWRSVGYGRSLGEALITEGLADHFARELVPTQVMPWTTPLAAGPRFLCGLQLRLHLPWRSHNHRLWFFSGSRLLGIPRWAGYSLGFEFVGRYLKKVRKEASECHDTPASKILGNCP